jgi:hypothetical protein
MAVIGPRPSLRPAVSLRLALSLVLLAAAVGRARGDDFADLRARLHDVANSLSTGNPAAAISGFSKSFKDYEQLRRFFDGLATSYQVENEIDFLDEPKKEAAQPVIHVRWALTVSEPQTNYTNQRSAEIEIRFAREKSGWKIIGFSPITLFDPAEAQRP